MLQDLWTQMSTFLGAWPGLPAGASLSGTPEGFWFTGVSAWTALNDVLDYLGLKVVCNPTLTSPYSIVVDAADDATYAALLTRYLTNLEDDLEWIDVGAGRVPATVKVFFRRRNSVYGTEETVRRDSPQWNMTPTYPVSINAPAEFASAVGTHHLWSDFTVRFDEDGSPLAADTAMAALIAQERVTQYYRKIDPGGHTYRHYAGALPFTTGSLVDGVCWYQNYSGDGYQGWRTHTVRGASPPWAGIWS